MTFDIEHPYVLTATCASRMGTTAAVTTFLATRRFYIVEMQQFDDTISQRFFVRVTFCGVQGEPVDLAALRREFVTVATAEDMEWQIHDSHDRARVLIMVSNYDHCLEDLLYRHRIGELAMDITAIVSNHVTMQPVGCAESNSVFSPAGQCRDQAAAGATPARVDRVDTHRSRGAGALHADSLG